jgi:hypothetical protein
MGVIGLVAEAAVEISRVRGGARGELVVQRRVEHRYPGHKQYGNPANARYAGLIGNVRCFP